MIKSGSPIYKPGDLILVKGRVKVVWKVEDNNAWVLCTDGTELENLKPGMGFEGPYKVGEVNINFVFVSKKAKRVAEKGSGKFYLM